MATLYYQGHASFRLTTNSGRVFYLDPYAGVGYDVPADVILSTHEHRDHNKVDLPARKPDCIVIRSKDAIIDGVYQSFDLFDVHVQAVMACNEFHDPRKCCGYVITVDGKTLYLAGDTDATPEMWTTLHDMQLDYAILPMDGDYNMDAETASLCAKIIGAKHTIPDHTDLDMDYNPERAELFQCEGRILLPAGESLEL